MKGSADVVMIMPIRCTANTCAERTRTLSASATKMALLKDTRLSQIQEVRLMIRAAKIPGVTLSRGCRES